MSKIKEEKWKRVEIGSAMMMEKGLKRTVRIKEVELIRIQNTNNSHGGLTSIASYEFSQVEMPCTK